MSIGMTSILASRCRTDLSRASTVASGMSASTRRCLRRSPKTDPKSLHGKTTTTEIDPTHPWAISRPTNSHRKCYYKHRPYEAKKSTKGLRAKMDEDRVSGHVGSYSLEDRTTLPKGRFHSPKSMIIHLQAALKRARLEARGFLPRRGY